jgi:hypothetical protein
MMAMADFRKAQPRQAFLKMGLYGLPGSGKTFTSLLIAEGLAHATGRRVAFVDTEHGTDFYARAVPSRKAHPAAFEFDALYTRSITEISAEVKDLDPGRYGVLVIDSITHVWEACRLAYEGRKTKAGTIPLYTWGQIKKPYKDLIAFLLSAPFHVLICGRQGNEYAEDEESGELKCVGVNMRSEGETPYEPHILIRMEAEKIRGKKEAIITAFAEKDRTGVLAGRKIERPSFENLARPLLGLLGGTQARVPTDDEVGAADAEALAEQELRRAEASRQRLEEFAAELALARTEQDVEAVSACITPDIKLQMRPADVSALRENYLQAKRRVRRHLAYADD